MYRVYFEIFMSRANSACSIKGAGVVSAFIAIVNHDPPPHPGARRSTMADYERNSSSGRLTPGM